MVDESQKILSWSFPFPHFTVDRLREKQYQLAAQKRNEAVLKYNLYQQTANYFERECRIAKQYNSWNVKDFDHKGQLEKARKSERLLVRRNKLRFLLKNEEEVYKKELDELKTAKSRPPVPSLETLKEKLKEKKAEQSLYFPKTCRRYQSYFACPRGQASVSSNSIWNTIQNTNFQRDRVCRDSTNLLHQKDQTSCLRNFKMSTDQNKRYSNQKNQESYESYCAEESNEPNPKYSARYSRKSLENTNVGSDNNDEYVPTRRLDKSFENLNMSNEGSAMFENEVSRTDNKENRQTEETSREYSVHSKRTENSSYGGSEHRPAHVTDSDVRKVSRQTEETSCEYSDHSKRTENSTYGDREHRQTRVTDSDARDEDHSLPLDSEESEAAKSPQKNSNEDSTANQPEMSVEDLHDQEVRDEVDRCNLIKDNHDQKILNASDTREFESEKSLPWLRMDPADKNLSKEMFLYLTHKELKCKIDDLSKRESHACTKHSWDEALRLRDMRNRLDVIREKRLYNTEHLELDEDVRKVGLDNIRKREEQLASREFACMDSTMYSDEAKALWEKWVREDENFEIKDARAQREILMNTLEKVWQGLAIQDKDKITRSFEHGMTTAEMQEDHKFGAALSSARMKSSDAQ